MWARAPSSKTAMPLPSIPPLSLSPPCLEDFVVFKHYFLNSKATVRSEQFNRYGHLIPEQGGPSWGGRRCQDGRGSLETGGELPLLRNRQKGRAGGGSRCQGQAVEQRQVAEFIQGWGCVNVISKRTGSKGVHCLGKSHVGPHAGLGLMSLFRSFIKSSFTAPP